MIHLGSVRPANVRTARVSGPGEKSEGFVRICVCQGCRRVNSWRSCNIPLPPNAAVVWLVSWRNKRWSYFPNTGSSGMLCGKCWVLNLNFCSYLQSYRRAINIILNCAFPVCNCFIWLSFLAIPAILFYFLFFNSYCPFYALHRSQVWTHPMKLMYFLSFPWRLTLQFLTHMESWREQ